MTLRFTLILTALIASLTASAITVEVSPGTLHKNLGSELTATTELTLTGSINAHDIYTLRDECKALQSLDLTDVEIAASQSERMAGGVRIDYKADELPECALFGSPIKELKLPRSLKTIGDAALADTRIKQLTIPAGVTKIGAMAFYSSDIETISIPKGIASIGDYAFGRSALKRLDLTETELTQVAKGFAYCADKLETVLLPASVTSIGDYALQGTSSLTTFHIPLQTQHIGQCAMLGCGSTVVRVPKATQYVGDYAFAYMPNLTEVSVSGNPDYPGVGAFAGCQALESLSHNSLTDMPDLFLADSPSAPIMLGTVENVGRYALLNNASESFALGKNTDTLGDGALEGMTALTEIDAALRSDNVTQTGTDTFKGIAPTMKVLVQAEKDAPWREHPDWGRFIIYSPAGVDEVDADFGINLRFEGALLLIDAASPISSITIHNVAGQTLALSEPAAANVRIDTSAFNEPIYVVSICCNDKTKTYKLIR